MSELIVLDFAVQQAVCDVLIARDLSLPAESAETI
jgi:hypothetical protein